MKNTFILLISMLLLTGCKATANVSIDKDIVRESVSITSNDTSEYNEMKNWGGFPVPLYFDQSLQAPLWMPNREKEAGVLYYDVVTNDSNKTIVASANFSRKEHSRSSLVRRCFKLYNVIDEEEKTIFSTSKGLICALNNFDVVVQTPYLVVNNNASKVDNETNTYTWNVNKNNSKDISIYLEIDFSKKYNQSEDDPNEVNNGQIQNSEKKTSVLTYIIIGIIIVIMLIISAFYLNKKKKEVSDI